MSAFVVLGENFPVSPLASPLLAGGKHSKKETSTTATIISLEEEASFEEVEVVHTHDADSSTAQTLITTHSVRSVMALQLDKYGFIVNIDSKGHVVETHGDEAIRVPTFAEAQRTERREDKWNAALKGWGRQKRQQQQPATEKRFLRGPLQHSPALAAAPIPSKVVLRRLRKGIPDAVRGKVWCALGGGIRQPGLYQEIVQKTSDAMLETYRELRDKNVTEASKDPLGLGEHSDDDVMNTSDCTSPTASTDVSSTPPANKKRREKKSKQQPEKNVEENFAATRNFRGIQDTIERDIHRTYPRHNLFYEEDRHKEEPSSRSPPSSPASLMAASGLCDPELASLILNLETDIRVASSGETSGPVSNFGAGGGNTGVGSAASATPGGQAALRRVLRAYSYYDPEVGYCQGMNFIAGMFLTVMSEEEAFWLLVSVMNNYPCKMRGMFSEGMRETHKVLHVAEKLIHHHLPRLARHFDKEHVHVTMYATQWLLTQYTSSFHFDLVLRVWDCFLGEGWKIIYRVMLALLQKHQAQLMKMSFEEILAFFRELPDLVEGHQVIDLALKIPLRRKVIARYETEWDKQNSEQASA